MSKSLVSGPILTNKNGDFVDTEGRKVTLKGINVDAGSKLPFSPNVPSQTSSSSKLFWDGDNVSFIGRPFPVSEAREHFLRIKSWGYNVVRYIITWEALEHVGPGKYDEDFIDYTIQILEIIRSIGGIYVFIDPHQDVWSRFSGGSGAPLWTFYAAGLNPQKFKATGAAILHGDCYSGDVEKVVEQSVEQSVEQDAEQDPSVYAKMLWPSNYYKLACSTMFTLFFSGKLFAPNAILDGVNVQDYLQSHFCDSFKHFLSRVKSKSPGLFDETLFGIEMMNEPNKGLYGRTTFRELPEEQKLMVGPTPTLMQCLLMGMGHQQVVDDYQITITGPKKTGQTLIDPQGECAWLSSEDAELIDAKYGWKRGASWRLGSCVWAQNGLWDTTTGRIMNTSFFSRHPHNNSELNQETFTNGQFVEYYKRFKDTMRSVDDKLYILLHPMVLESPPKLAGTSLIDDRIIYAPHYYDGLSLMSKSWNRYYNVDTLGIMRGRYYNPVFGLVLGETNIRKCIRKQFVEIKQEGKKFLGQHVPVIMTETGMPFDMDDCSAYKDNNYSSQTAALDALGFALEGADISHTWWCYCHINSHKWGDSWNCEDFSFYSPDDVKRTQIFSKIANSKHSDVNETVISVDTDSSFTEREYDDAKQPASSDGVRAVNAVIRPYALKINGANIAECEFDLHLRKYKLTIANAKSCFGDNSELCTEIFVPKHHFNIGDEDSLDVVISSGNYVVDEERELVKWSHDSGVQTIEISNYGEKPRDFVCSWKGIFGCS